MNYGETLCTLFNFSLPAWRPGWINADWRVEAQDFGHGPELRRIGPGAINLPWGPTEADMLAEDWQSEPTPVPPYITEGTFGWAVECAKTGEEVGAGVVRMTLESIDVGEDVPYFCATFPNGTCGVFRPQLQDLLRTDWHRVN